MKFVTRWRSSRQLWRKHTARQPGVPATRLTFHGAGFIQTKIWVQMPMHLRPLFLSFIILCSWRIAVRRYCSALSYTHCTNRVVFHGRWVLSYRSHNPCCQISVFPKDAIVIWYQKSIFCPLPKQTTVSSLCNMVLISFSEQQTSLFVQWEISARDFQVVGPLLNSLAVMWANQLVAGFPLCIAGRKPSKPKFMNKSALYLNATVWQKPSRYDMRRTDVNALVDRLLLWKPHIKLQVSLKSPRKI